MNAVRIRADIAAMEAYTPTSSLEVFAEQLGRPVNEIIKLDANENPFGPSPKALAALASLDVAHIYPDPEARKLRQMLSEYVGVSPDYLLAGAGSDELIDLILRVFIEPGDTIINTPPTFGMYSFDAPQSFARIVDVPRRDDFSLDVEAIEAAANENDAKLLFVCSPNNPDGCIISPETLDRLLQLSLVVVLDEAYIEFSGLESAARRVPTTPNLIVLRTFSKWAGLAGLRVGYGIFPLELTPHLWKIKQPYYLNVAADAAARASLDDLPALRLNVDKLVAERKRLERELAVFPFLKPYPSYSNFVLCRVEASRAHSTQALTQHASDRTGGEGDLPRFVKKEITATDLKTALAAEGILIRYYSKTGLRDKVRISAGTPEQNDKLLAALRKIGGNHA